MPYPTFAPFQRQSSLISTLKIFLRSQDKVFEMAHHGRFLRRTGRGRCRSHHPIANPVRKWIVSALYFEPWPHSQEPLNSPVIESRAMPFCLCGCGARSLYAISTTLIRWLPQAANFSAPAGVRHLPAACRSPGEVYTCLELPP
jgi:hypothetical protein